MALDNARDIAAGRARRDRLELLVGLGVALLLAVLVVLALVGRKQPGDGGYPLHAAFSHIDGLSVGSDVRLAGVTVGHVRSAVVDPHSFQADIVFSVAPNIQLPSDSGAVITSDSLLGGKYLALTPGGETEMLKPGGTIGETQGAISLEQLLSKFIFSVTDSLQKKAAPSPAAPETAPGPAPAIALPPASQPAPAPQAPLPRAPASQAPAPQPSAPQAASGVSLPVSSSDAAHEVPSPQAPASRAPLSRPSSVDPARSQPASGALPGDVGGQVELPSLPSIGEPSLQ